MFNGFDSTSDGDAGSNKNKGATELFYMEKEGIDNQDSTSSLNESIYSAIILYMLVPVGENRDGKVRAEDITTSTHKTLPDRNTDGTMGVVGLCCMDPLEGNECSLWSGCFAYLVASGPWLLLLAFNCTIQALFVYYIGKLVHELIASGDVAAFAAEDMPATSLYCPAEAPLRLAAVVTLTCYSFGEIFETLDMYWWVMYMKTTPNTEQMQVLYDVESGEPTEIASGLSKWFKWFVYLCIILPKFAIGVLLWWYGASYVAMSENNSELILNTVAVLFVLEIDDQLYKVTVPSAIRAVFEALPPVKTGGVISWFSDCGVLLGQWINMGIIAGMSASVLKFRC